MHIFKNGDKIVPANYKTIMTSHILAKLYGLILENKIEIGLVAMIKELKGNMVLGETILLSTISSLSASFPRNVARVKVIYFVAFWTSENPLTFFPGISFGTCLMRSSFLPS